MTHDKKTNLSENFQGGRRLLPISAAPRGLRRGRSGPGHLQLRAVALWPRRAGGGQLCGAGGFAKKWWIHRQNMAKWDMNRDIH